MDEFKRSTEIKVTPTYEQIKDAVSFFNENGISASELEKNLHRMQDKAFWEGFDVAIELVSNVFSDYKEKEFDNIWSDIEEEVELYKKDS